MRIRLGLIVALIAAVGMTSAPVTAAPAAIGFLRFIHASPDAPALDVYFDQASKPAITDIEFKKATDFIPLLAKPYTIAIRAANGKVNDPALAKIVVTLAPGESVDVMALGLFSGKNPLLRLSIFPLDRTVTKGKARVEVIHAAPNAPSLDLLDTGKPVINALSFGNAAPRTLTLDPNSYDFSFAAAGKDTTALLDLTGTRLAADTIYTIVVLNNLKNIEPLILTSRNATGFLRIIHASPDTDGLDLYLDNANKPTVIQLQFGTQSSFLELPAKAYDIALRLTGSPMTDPPLYTTRITLLPGEALNAVALGLSKTKGSQKLRLGVFVTDRSNANGKARIELIDASPDAPTIDILVNGKPTIRSLMFGEASPTLDLPPDSYDLAVTKEGTTKPTLIPLAGTRLLADKLYTFLALNTANKLTGLEITADLPTASTLFTTVTPTLTATALPAVTPAATAAQ